MILGTLTDNSRFYSAPHKPEKHMITLAGGCFWGVQHYFDQVFGVIGSMVGYANGATDVATYETLHQTDHVEAVQIEYDAHVVSLAELLERLYRIIDPCSVNQQGNDRGRQYRTGIYVSDPSDWPCVCCSLETLKERVALHTDAPVAIEAQPLSHFVPAEMYHQKYLEVHPGGYCHIPQSVASEQLFLGPASRDAQHDLKNLSELAFEVTQHKGTEHPFTSLYELFDEPGIYVDVVGGQPLFSSDDKFDSGCGWPSFSRPITTDALRYHADYSHGMQRVEVVSAEQNSHEGHVFIDGPHEHGSLRFCINGAALLFVPFEEMDAQGYGALKPFVSAWRQRYETV